MYALSLFRVHNLIDVNDSERQRTRVIASDANEHKWLQVNTKQTQVIACDYMWPEPIPGRI
jgi:hypothetical protein